MLFCIYHGITAFVVFHGVGVHGAAVHSHLCAEKQIITNTQFMQLLAHAVHHQIHIIVVAMTAASVGLAHINHRLSTCSAAALPHQVTLPSTHDNTVQS